MKVYAVQSVDYHQPAPYILCVFETESLAREYVKKHCSKYPTGCGTYLEVRSWNVLNKIE